MLHLTHGRHLLIERVTNANAPQFPRRTTGPWWPAIDYDTTDDAWRKDLQLLDDYHLKFIEAIKNATPEQLDRIPSPGDQPMRHQLVGVAYRVVQSVRYDGCHLTLLLWATDSRAGLSPSGTLRQTVSKLVP